MKLIMHISVILFACIFALFSHAQLKEGLKIYHEPSLKSGIASITYNKHDLVVIYKDKNKPDWLKVADTSNGHVGWLQAKDFKTQSKINEPKVYKYFEYSGPKKMDDQQAQKMMQAMEAEHHRMIQQMNQMMSNFEQGIFKSDFFKSDFFSMPFQYRQQDEAQKSNKPQVVLPDDKRV